MSKEKESILENIQDTINGSDQIEHWEEQARQACRIVPANTIGPIAVRLYYWAKEVLKTITKE